MKSKTIKLVIGLSLALVTFGRVQALGLVAENNEVRLVNYGPDDHTFVVDGKVKVFVQQGGVADQQTSSYRVDMEMFDSCPSGYVRQVERDSSGKLNDDGCVEKNLSLQSGGTSTSNLG